jgi:hypothetical protein
MSLCSSCDQMSSPSMFERVALHITLRFRQEEYTLVSSQLKAIKDLEPANQIVRIEKVDGGFNGLERIPCCQQFD